MTNKIIHQNFYLFVHCCILDYHEQEITWKQLMSFLFKEHSDIYFLVIKLLKIHHLKIDQQIKKIKNLAAFMSLNFYAAQVEENLFTIKVPALQITLYLSQLTKEKIEEALKKINYQLLK